MKTSKHSLLALFFAVLLLATTAFAVLAEADSPNRQAATASPQNYADIAEIPGAEPTVLPKKPEKDPNLSFDELYAPLYSDNAVSWCRRLQKRNLLAIADVVSAQSITVKDTSSQTTAGVTTKTDRYLHLTVLTLSVKEWLNATTESDSAATIRVITVDPYVKELGFADYRPASNLKYRHSNFIPLRVDAGVMAMQYSAGLAALSPAKEATVTINDTVYDLSSYADYVLNEWYGYSLYKGEDHYFAYDTVFSYNAISFSKSHLEQGLQPIS